jgi:two-component system, NarL family, invasion response regulator UvrY
MVNILVVDDHPLVRMGIAQVLADELPEASIEQASDAPETMKAVWDKPLHLVLLDLSLRGRSGLDLLKEIKNARPKLPVLILSSYPEEQFATRALRAGAAGYLNKDTHPDTLIQAVRRALAGGKFVTPETAERLATELTIDTSKPLHEQLSDREYDILLRIASGQSVSEIASTLTLSVKTVSTYRTRLLLKMRKQNNAELTHYAIHNKLVE